MSQKQIQVCNLVRSCKTWHAPKPVSSSVRFCCLTDVVHEPDLRNANDGCDVRIFEMKFEGTELLDSLPLSMKYSQAGYNDDDDNNTDDNNNDSNNNNNTVYSMLLMCLRNIQRFQYTVQWYWTGDKKWINIAPIKPQAPYKKHMFVLYFYQGLYSLSGWTSYCKISWSL